MTLNILNFKVLDTTTGKMQQSGRTSKLFLSQSTLKNGETEEVAVPGTPDAISSGALYGVAHMGSSYIKLVRNVSNNLGYDAVYVPDLLRVTMVYKVCDYKNTVCYAFSQTNSAALDTLTWHVLIGNGNSQTDMDYFDLQLPGYSNTYIVFILIPNGWNNRVVVDEGNKVCSMPGNLSYYCINPNMSTLDTGTAHTINIQGKNKILTRLTIGFEDTVMTSWDRDYNDELLSLTGRVFDQGMLNDITLN